MQRVTSLCPELVHGRALDFGCGVGRLTQGLTTHFGQVTGVDISTRMIQLAQSYNQHAARVSYVCNTAPDLTLFASDTFDFVLSVITLQHVAPEYSRRYLRDFVRICAPGGLAWFQVPDRLANPRRRRLSWYPPTVAKKLWRRINAYLAVHAAMEMHVMPQDEVVAEVRAAGGEIVTIDRSASTGADFINYSYLVRKTPK
jgi:2-polyprenyl-3-methyl-5-hydroxy-6-metoxy-1,4-benzoquinol methylase